MKRKQISTWYLADWAGTAWPTVVKTFVFAAYFSSTYTDTPENGTVLWCNMLAFAGFVIAVSSPFMGILVDQKATEHTWYCLCTLLVACLSCLLWFAHPSIIGQHAVLMILALGTIAYELSYVFYNTLLMRITNGKNSGKHSGIGRGVGFLGGLGCLVIALNVFIKPSPYISHLLNSDMAENVRIIGPLVGLWILLFSIPAMIQLPRTTQSKSLSTPIPDRFKQALTHYLGLRDYLRKRPKLARFMFTQMIYTDGLNTLFATAGIFAMNTFHLTLEEMLVFAIACNVSAAFGSIAFSWVDVWFGPKNLIQVCLAGMIVFGIGFVSATSTLTFYFFALVSTLFVGPIQAATRTYLIQAADPKEANTIFSIASLTGKVTAFAGPMLVSLATTLSQSSRVGHGSIILFFVAALLMMRQISRPEDVLSAQQTQSSLA